MIRLNHSSVIPAYFPVVNSRIMEVWSISPIKARVADESQQRRDKFEKVSLRNRKKADPTSAKQHGIQKQTNGNAVNIPIPKQDQDAIYRNIKDWIKSTDTEMQLHGIILARSLLCDCKLEELHTNISILLNAEIISDCVQFLMSGNSKLVVETTWLLSNIAAGNGSHTDHLVKAGVIQPIILLLRSADPEIVEHSMRTLGNCMGDHQETRLSILSMRAIPALIEVVKKFRNHVTNMRTLAFTLHNASKIENPGATSSTPSIFEIEQILLGIQTLILVKDTDILSSVCWTVYNITGSGPAGISAVLRAGLLPKLMLLLDSNETDISLPCLKITANIATCEIAQLVKYGIIMSLARFLKLSNLEMVYDAVWTLSNIAEGSLHVKEIFVSQVFDNIVPVIRSATCTMHIKKEGLYIISSLATRSEGYYPFNFLDKIEKNNLMAAIASCLKLKDVNVIEVAMKAVGKIFKLYKDDKEKNEFILTQFEAHGGIEEIDSLSYHVNTVISDMATKLLERYFPSDGQDIDDAGSDSNEDDGFVYLNTHYEERKGIFL